MSSFLIKCLVPCWYVGSRLSLIHRNRVFLDTPTKAHVSVTLKKSFAFTSASKRVEVGAGILFLLGKFLWLSIRSCRLIALYPFLLQV